MVDSQFAFSDPLGAGTQARQVPPPPIDFSSWEYTSIKRRLVQYAQQAFGDDYNNFVEGDFGAMLLEMLAFQSDLQSFKMDYYVNEAFLPTASLEKNVRRHARRVGYKPRPRVAAHYDLTISVNDAYSVDIIIPVGFQLQVGGPDGRSLFFEIYAADSDGNILEGENVIIPAGVTSVSNAIGIEGQTKGVTSTGTGEAFQSVEIPDQEVLPTSVRYFVDGEEWREVEALVEVGNQPIFRVEQDDRTNRLFTITGDGVRGATVPNGSDVRVTYRVGGGSRGNVPSGFIDITSNIAVAGTSISAPVLFTNRTRGIGGSERETIDEIKRNLPAWFKTQGRAVHADDYTTLANLFYDENAGRVARGKAFIRHAGCSANIIDIFLLEYINDTEVVEPSDRLMSAVKDAMIEVGDMAHSICVKKGQFVPFDTRLFIQVNRTYQKQKQEIENKIRNRFLKFFALSRWSLGKTLKREDLSVFLGAIQEISTIQVQFTTDPGFPLDENGNYVAKHWQLARPRNLELNLEFVSE